MLQLAVAVLLLAVSEQSHGVAAAVSPGAANSVHVSTSSDFLQALANEAIQNISIRFAFVLKVSLTAVLHSRLTWLATASLKHTTQSKQSACSASCFEQQH